MSNARTWTDSAGVMHDLAAVARMSIGEAALFLKCSTRTVHSLKAAQELGPVLRKNRRSVELFVPCLRDYLARKIFKS